MFTYINIQIPEVGAKSGYDDYLIICVYTMTALSFVYIRIYTYYTLIYVCTCMYIPIPEVGAERGR